MKKEMNDDFKRTVRRVFRLGLFLSLSLSLCPSLLYDDVEDTRTVFYFFSILKRREENERIEERERERNSGE